jgi:type I site-specific restriction endonuclease
MGASAVGAFEIAVFDECHRSIARPQRVIAFVYRNGKLRCLHESVSVRRKPNARHTCFFSAHGFIVAAADYAALSGNPHKVFAFV